MEEGGWFISGKRQGSRGRSHGAGNRGKNSIPKLPRQWRKQGKPDAICGGMSVFLLGEEIVPRNRDGIWKE